MDPSCPNHRTQISRYVPYFLPKLPHSHSGLSPAWLRAARPAQPHPPGHPYMDTFRRLFSCGPIFGKKTEEEEGDAAKEVTGAR